MRIALAAVLAAVLALAVCTRDRPAGRGEQAATWDRDAGDAFAPLTGSVPELVAGAREWLAGERPAEQFDAELRSYEARFAAALGQIQKLRPYPFDSRVKTLYEDTALLYSQVAALYRSMLDAPRPELRAQEDLHARRVRTLADRVFDRARALVVPHLGDTPDPAVDIRLPEEVPNWVEEGLAPGPPLVPAPPPPPSGTPQLRQATRPEQPRDRWLLVVTGANPSTRGASAADAQLLTSVVEAMRPVPDPEGGREESARIRLSLLADAEAGWAAALGHPEVVDALHVVGQHLWSGPGLPARRL